MALIDVNWLNANETRSYPLHDLASAKADDGSLLPKTLITDIYIRVPKTEHRIVYISSLAISPELVSLVFSSTNIDPFSVDQSSTSPDAVLPLGVVTVRKAVVLYKNYAIVPLTDGVGGWVCFGAGARDEEACSLRFSTAEQSMLLDRCVNSYDAMPVSTISKYAASAKLTGVVRLAGREGSTRTSKGTRIIDGKSREVVLIQVLAEDQVQRLQDLAGPCGHRPGEGTCNKPVIASVNSVVPDCGGNIDLEFKNGIVVGSIENGLVLDYPTGLGDVCVKIDPNKLPTEVTDTVCGSDAPIPLPSESSSDYNYSSSIPEPSDPQYCETFDVNPEELEEQHGDFIVEDGKWISTVPDSYARTNGRRMAEPYVVKCSVRPPPAGEAHVTFATSLSTNKRDRTWFAGVVLAGYEGGTLQNRIFIGYHEGGAMIGGNLGLGYSALPAATYSVVGDLPITEYYIYVYVDYVLGNQRIILDVIWAGGSLHKIYYPDLPITTNGFCGIGTLVAGTEFNFFGANCDSSSSESSSSSTP